MDCLDIAAFSGSVDTLLEPVDVLFQLTPGQRAPVFTHRFRWRLGFFAPTHVPTFRLIVPPSARASEAILPPECMRSGHLLAASTTGKSRSGGSFVPMIRFARAVGSLYPPGFVGVIAGRQEIRQPLALPFWAKPVSHFGLLKMTTVQQKVRVPSHSRLREVAPPVAGSLASHSPLFRLMSSRYGRGEAVPQSPGGWELRPASDHQLSALLPRLLLISQFTPVSSKRVAPPESS